MVREFLLAGMPVTRLYAKPEFLGSLPSALIVNIKDIEAVSYEELKQISTLSTPHNALAVVQSDYVFTNNKDLVDGLVPALDFIQDPGNMGTIIRASAWFGIKDIVCSENCVDLYNPKVIQASMGAILHVKVHYKDIREFLKEAGKEGCSIFGAMLDGQSVYEHPLAEKGIILIGNESKGISDDLEPYVTDRIKIPRFGVGKLGIDSLNAGMAASVIFSEFARRKYQNN